MRHNHNVHMYKQNLMNIDKFHVQLDDSVPKPEENHRVFVVEDPDRRRELFHHAVCKIFLQSVMTRLDDTALNLMCVARSFLSRFVNDYMLVTGDPSIELINTQILLVACTVNGRRRRYF